MGEVFFDNDIMGNLNQASHNPANETWLSKHQGNSEKFALCAGRGRFVERRQKNAKSNFFYAPIYPELISGVPVIRNNGSRIIRRFLLDGASAHGLAGRQEKEKKVGLVTAKTENMLSLKQREPENYLWNLGSEDRMGFIFLRFPGLGFLF